MASGTSRMTVFRGVPPPGSPEARTQTILKTLNKPGRNFYIVLLVATLGLLWFLQAWAYQLQYGLIATDMADWGTSGGVSWGLYIGSFIWWVGIAHGGIIMSAAVRLFKLNVFKPITRIAEMVTVGALSVAGMFIVVDLGRPDRVVTSIIPHFFARIHYSPLVWDVTVITFYFIMSATYLFLSLRDDIYHLRNRLPKVFSPVYRLLLIDHDPEENVKIQRMLWWLAFAVIIMAPLLLHGGVIPWLFQVLPSMPGWNSAVNGPQFLSIALASAMSGIAIVAYIFRRAYGWKDIIPDKTFSRLGAVMALFALFVIWLELQQIVTGLYAPTTGLGTATDARVASIPFWISMGLIIFSMLYLAAQTIFPKKLFSVPRTVGAGVIILLGTFLEKVLFVVDGLAHPAFNFYPGVPGDYFPTWVELSSFLGAVCIVILWFALASKVIPVVEVVEQEEEK